MSSDSSDLLHFSDFPVKPDFAGELQLMRCGASHIAGVDEAGRGPLAGPVVAAAVILDRDNIPAGLDDSKRLSARQRAALYEAVMMQALAVSVCGLSARSIDRSDIRRCSLEAMRRAVQGLAIRPCHALVDGRDIPPGLPCGADSWIKGDRRSASIAAASIIAKVLRDRMMARAGLVYPAYQLERHAGYATVAHRGAIEEHGPVGGLHRYSFAPLKGRFVDEADDSTGD